MWFSMTPEKRRAHFQKVASAPVTSGDRASAPQGQFQPSLSLSVDVHSLSELVSLPLPCLEGIWQKATELLNTLGTISSAPGHPTESRMVMSRTDHRPHLVLPCSRRCFKCDSDCLNYKSLGIWSHCVVVAELNQQL